jgi:hypothetical protein
MEIMELFEQYAGRVAQIHLYQRAVKKTAQNELQQLEEYAKSLEERPDIKNLSSSYDRMLFPDAKDGIHRVFGSKVSSVEDRQLAVILHKNKQYQWLLAEVYEEFEDFMENAYAFAGLSDNNFWPLNDYGSISLEELKEKDFEWYVKQAKKKRDVPHSILNQFRKAYPDIANIETDNMLKINLKLSVVLIENLRHVIVHKGGVVTDKQKFMEDVLKKSGLYNNGKYKKEYVDRIESLFGTGEYENTVCLLEVRVKPELPIDIHVNLFDVLSGYLMAYAHLICEFMESNQKPI